MHDRVRSTFGKLRGIAVATAILASPAIAAPQLELLTEPTDASGLARALPASIEAMTQPDARFQVWSTDVRTPAESPANAVTSGTLQPSGVDGLGGAFGQNNPLIPLPPTVFGGALGLFAVIRLTLRRQQLGSRSVKLH